MITLRKKAAAPKAKKQASGRSAALRKSSRTAGKSIAVKKAAASKATARKSAAARKPAPRPSAKAGPRPAKPAVKAPVRAAAKGAPTAAKSPAPASRKAAHPTRPAPTATAAPKSASKRPAKALAPVAVVAAPAAPVQEQVKEPAKERPSRKPKPPAKTMQVPAPVTDILLKQALPDVRRVATAALLTDAARGFSSPAGEPRTRSSDPREEPPVDASLIAASLGDGAHPKIEDNYDYSVVEELVASPHCPTPTRMVNTGCGGGEAAVFFARRGYSVVGIDSDRTAVGLARERAWLAGVEIDFMVGDLFETPNLLPAESFGLAIDRGIFYKLSEDRDRQRYLTNIRRLLFQGGVCYLSAGFFPLGEGAPKPRSQKKASPKILLVREGGVVVNECRQAGFDVLHRVLRPTADSGEYGELLLYLRK